MANNSQLARIVAPNINEADYAGKMQEAFDNINENFKKIASLPFLQGVKGDSYEIKEHKIWYDGTENPLKTPWTLTFDGALLLNSIFGTHFSEDDKYSECKRDIPTLRGVSPLEFFGAPGENPKNNILYFYSVIDDVGKETQQQLGQYYYFIDGRLTKIGEAYDNPDDELINFVDCSGFYYYVPTHIEDGVTINEHYEKTALLPTIYYDANKNDICWEFKGVRTGISAIGVPGADGKTANLKYVKVNVDDDFTYTAQIMGLFKYNEDNLQGYWSNAEKDLQKIQEDDNLLICIFKNDMQYKFAFGLATINGGNPFAYWNRNMEKETLTSIELMNQYFYGMGKNSMASYPKFLSIPSFKDRPQANNDDKKYSAHTLATTEYSGGIGFKDLIFRHMHNAIGATGYPSRDTNKRNAIFDNYNVKFTEVEYYDTLGEDRYPEDKPYTEITDKTIIIDANANNKKTIIGSTGVSTGTGNFGNDVDVNGKITARDMGHHISIGMPIGSIIMWYGNVYERGGFYYPNNTEYANSWVVCRGNNIASSPEFADLLAVTGATKLPNLGERFPVGVSGNIGLGDTAGNSKHTLTVDEIPAHNHNVVAFASGSGGYTKLGIVADRDATTKIVFNKPDNGASSGSVDTDGGTKNTGGGKEFSIMPPYCGVHFLIKYK